MILKDLEKLFPYCEIKGNSMIQISGLHFDSRKIKPGYIFCPVKGIPGVMKDRSQFVQSAINNGAVALLTESFMDGINIPQVKVKEIWKKIALLSSYLNDYPSEKLNLVGVTGTNGKTTTSHLIASIFKYNAKSTGLLGNLGANIGDEFFKYEGNTPESPDLQAYLKKMVDTGMKNCVMEVSSHSLSLGRVLGCDFDSTVFTNLTQDHLDFHGSFENYKRAKGLLFSRMPNDLKSKKFAVLNSDDPTSEYFSKITPARVITYAIKNKGADVVADDIKLSSYGTEFTLKTTKGNIHITIPLIGKFNVYNTLAAISVALINNIALKDIVMALKNVPIIKGRMERVENESNIIGIIDYAHTPDGLMNALKTLNGIKDKSMQRIVTVFGCGGDRDKTKRSIMGHIAVKFSDYVILTSDNPRFENPEKILDDIKKGTKDFNNYLVEENRHTAIEKAVNICKDNDILLIAGKGHEDYQIVGDSRLHFDDAEELKRALLNRGKK